MMDWEECVKKKIVKSVSEDKELIDSLSNASLNKLKSSDELSFSEVTTVSKVSLAYDSVRELLEALALKKGYKVYNHECYTSFLKEVLNRDDLGEEFDEIRIIRNSLNYYGKEISLEETEEVLERIRNLRERVLDLMN